MKDFEFPVEYVFPYVNPKDPAWIAQYQYCAGKPYLEDVDARFRDFSFLKYIFRSIEMYAPWFDKVHILLKDESQIPDFLNKDCEKLKITYHKDFIPSEYLPCFNSNTIEAFLSSLQTTEQFVYGNDDFLFRNPTLKSDFFNKDGSKVKLCYYTKTSKIPKEFDNLVKRCWELVAYKKINYQIFKNKPTDVDITFLKQFHGAAAPRLLSDCKNCFNAHTPKILKSLTMFRNNLVNLNQYIYSWESLIQGHYLKQLNSYMGTYFGLDVSKEVSKIIEGMKNCRSKMMVINDTQDMRPDHYKKICAELEKLYPIKSSFEL